jgi:hypothetical protein
MEYGCGGRGGVEESGVLSLSWGSRIVCDVSPAKYQKPQNGTFFLPFVKITYRASHHLHFYSKR